MKTKTIDEQFELEGGATVCLWADRSAYTVIEVSDNGKRMKIQRDEVVRLNDPKMVPGGFSAICTNNNEIEYDYKRWENGHIYDVSQRKNGSWRIKGESMRSGRGIIAGRWEYYNFNF